MMEKNKIVKAADFLEKKLKGAQPEFGLVLGSGLGVLADEIENPVKVSYRDIPHFPVSTVAGHKGQLVIGTLEGRSVLAMQGRFHYYEGYTMEEVTFPIRVMKRLGVEKLFVTNAAGGINESFEPGNLMLIEDHINNFGTNPLIGTNDDELGARFPDMSRAYYPPYMEHALKIADQLSLPVQKGIYVGNSGPSYETGAEIRMLRKWGGDAVGMSTVPEVIIANHASMKVIGISCISNMAAGILDQPLSHDEVIETTEKVREDFLRYVKELIRTLPDTEERNG